jgi:phosphoribosylcarboxyaminoimidazole (NCAIR) mutase
VLLLLLLALYLLHSNQWQNCAAAAAAAAALRTAVALLHCVRCLLTLRACTLVLLLYKQTAAQRGLQVIIAGAGGAAHLPGTRTP